MGHTMCWAVLWSVGGQCPLLFGARGEDTNILSAEYDQHLIHSSSLLSVPDVDCSLPLPVRLEAVGEVISDRAEDVCILL